VDREQVTDLEVRREAIEAGAAWEHGLPPLSARTVIEAATNAYSAAWEGSRHQVRDHLRALTAALAAAEPILAKIKRRAGNPIAEARELIIDILADTVLPWRFHDDLPERVTVDVVMSSGTARITITDPTPTDANSNATRPIQAAEMPTSPPIAALSWFEGAPMVDVLSSTEILVRTRDVATGGGDRDRLMRTLETYGWVPCVPVTAISPSAPMFNVRPTHVCPRCHKYLNVHPGPPLELACVDDQTCGWEADDWSAATEYEEGHHVIA
jgi:hypothetical protein